MRNFEREKHEFDTDPHFGQDDKVQITNNNCNYNEWIEAMKDFQDYHTHMAQMQNNNSQITNNDNNSQLEEEMKDIPDFNEYMSQAQDNDDGMSM